MSTPIVFVFGTWGLKDHWWRVGSPLSDECERRGLPVLTPRFKWSGELGGTAIHYPSDPDDDFPKPVTPWLVAGWALRWYCQALAGEQPVHAIGHSHGNQVIAFAASYGQRFKTWLSISCPVRRDMQRVRRKARGNVERWIQTYDVADTTIIEGQFFGGSLTPTYEIPEADLSIPCLGYGHSGLLERLTAWTDIGLWEFFRPDIAIANYAPVQLEAPPAITQEMP